MRKSSPGFASSSFLSAGLPDPGLYRKSSLLESINPSEVITRNQTFNGVFPINQPNPSDFKSALSRNAFGNRTNLNVSFQVVDDIAKQKIESLVRKFENKKFADSSNNYSRSTSFERASEEGGSREESMLVFEGKTGDETRDGAGLFSKSSALDASKSRWELEELERDVQKTTELIQLLSKKLEDQSRNKRRIEEKRKQIHDFTDEKRKQYLTAVEENVELTESLKRENEKCSDMSHKIERLSKTLEETRYSISRLRVADQDFHDMKRIHYDLRKTLDRQKRLMESVGAEIEKEMTKPVHGGYNFVNLRPQRDADSHLSAMLYKLGLENQSLKRQIGSMRKIPGPRRLSKASNFTEGFKPIPRRSSVLSAKSTSSRKSSRASTAHSSISSSTLN